MSQHFRLANQHVAEVAKTFGYSAADETHCEFRFAKTKGRQSTRHLPWVGFCVWLSAILLPGAGLCAGEAESSMADAEFRDVVVNATVQVCDTNLQLLGSGVVVRVFDRGFEVLTAEHVVSARDRICIGFFAPRIGGKPGPLRTHLSVDVLAKDADRDLAYLRVNSGIPPATRLELADSPSEKTFSKLEAWTVEWVNSDKIESQAVSILENRSARRASDAQAVSFWHLDRASTPGMSGGPLMDRNGKLLGIASGNSRGKAYYVDQREIAAFLDANGLR